jgi:hypothetical protein
VETEAPKSPAKHYRERGILAYGERMGPKQADENGRAVGVRRTPVMRIDPNREIHPALKKKASRYCKLDYPYLVALNALSTYHNELALIDANRISAQELEGERRICSTQSRNLAECSGPVSVSQERGSRRNR